MVTVVCSKIALEIWGTLPLKK